MSVESFHGPGGAILSYRYDDFTDPWDDAPTAILCHGHPRNSNLWYAWVPLLSRHLRIVRPDLRGLGLSKVPIETFTNSVDSLVLDAIALLDHLKLDKAVWIGEGGGMLTGFGLGVHVPQRLHALVIMSAPLKVSEAPLYEHRQQLRPGESIAGQASIDLMLSKGMRAWAGLTVRTRPWLREAPTGYVEWYKDQISQNDPRLAAEFFRPIPQVDLRPLAKDIGAPTTFLDGDRDTMLPAAHRELLLQNPNVRVATIEGPGIDIGYARPEACAAQVKAFLRELRVLK